MFLLQFLQYSSKPPTGWPDKGKEKWFKSICRDKQAGYNG